MRGSVIQQSHIFIKWIGVQRQDAGGDYLQERGRYSIPLHINPPFSSSHSRIQTFMGEKGGLNNPFLLPPPVINSATTTSKLHHQNNFFIIQQILASFRLINVRYCWYLSTVYSLFLYYKKETHVLAETVRKKNYYFYKLLRENIAFVLCIL